MKDDIYHIPFRTRILRRILRIVFRFLFHLLSNVRITGKEFIPDSGAYLIAINHISLFEPPFAVAFWPKVVEAAGAVDIWDRTGQSYLVRWYGGIPVHRGEYDRKLIDTMLNVLKSNRPLLIAPEGGRTHTPAMRLAQPGIAYLADLAGVPVVPVGIVGTSDDFLKIALHGNRPKIEMRIGAPFTLPKIIGKGEDRRRNRQKNADLIMEHIALLLPPEYHGIYGSNPVLESGEESKEKGYHQ
jgi:1-acyl-sn-glycerol-3-phosphate acyltransferase